MAELDLLTRVGQLGSTVILLVILFFLWREYRDQNAFIRELLKEAEAERKVIARHVGLDTIQLKSEAQAMRERIEAEQARRASVN